VGNAVAARNVVTESDLSSERKPGVTARRHQPGDKRTVVGNGCIGKGARAIIRSQGPDSILKKAVGRDWKGKLSPVLYVSAIVATWLSPWISEGIFVAAAPNLAHSRPAY